MNSRLEELRTKFISNPKTMSIEEIKEFIQLVQPEDNTEADNHSNEEISENSDNVESTESVNNTEEVETTTTTITEQSETTSDTVESSNVYEENIDNFAVIETKLTYGIELLQEILGHLKDIRK